jgi:hypothetical protein
LTIAKQMKELDYSPAAIMFLRGADAVTWPQSMGKDGDYVLLAAGGNPEAKFPGMPEMVEMGDSWIIPCRIPQCLVTVLRMSALKQIKSVTEYSTVNEYYKKQSFISKTIVTDLLE